MGKMHMADEGVHSGLGGGKFYGRLPFGLDDFFDAKFGDFETVRLVEFIHQGEFDLVTLLHGPA